MKLEDWKDIRGWEGEYQVSSIGRVKRIEHVIHYSNGVDRVVGERILHPSMDRDGYMFIGLNRNQFKTGYRVHRLVAIAFIGDVPENMQINHKNGIKNDNRVENLEICTPSENTLHAFRVLGRKASGVPINPVFTVTAYNVKTPIGDKCNYEILDEYMTFDSIYKATIHIGCGHYAISRAIKTKKPLMGYFWIKNKKHE